tara:strand:+ start:547 stop:732 length:186 start_codon:yes stop_codon:yes gene_type:complete
MSLNALVVEYLFNDKTKEKLLKEVNKNVNIPIISEKTEAKILDALWDSVEEVLKKAILKGE